MIGRQLTSIFFFKGIAAEVCKNKTQTKNKIAVNEKSSFSFFMTEF